MKTSDPLETSQHEELAPSLAANIIAEDLTILRIVHELKRRERFWVRRNLREAIFIEQVSSPKGPPGSRKQITAHGLIYKIKKNELTSKSISLSHEVEDYWEWIQPPFFTAEAEEDVFGNRRLFTATEMELAAAKKAGARWSFIQNSLWIEADNDKAIAKLTALGVFEPTEEVYYKVDFYDRLIPAKIGARFVREKKLWALDARNTKAIGEMDVHKFERVISN
jgi:hypothetical protein